MLPRRIAGDPFENTGYPSPPTEAEWLSGLLDLGRMISCLDHQRFDRKLRLFACACCRRIWHLLDPGGRAVVEASERYADGGLGIEQLRAAVTAAASERGSSFPAFDAARASAAAFEAGYRSSAHSYLRSAVHVAGVVAYQSPLELTAEGDETRGQRGVLLDIIGNPFRPVAVDPAWRTTTAVALAEAIYADRAFDRLPILADALEDAGCDNPDLLTHLRNEGPHVRGCWAVDLILGKG